MNTNAWILDSSDLPRGGPRLVAEPFHFVHIVRRRISNLIVCAILGGIIGFVVFLTAERKYESFSEIMPLQPDGNVADSVSRSNFSSIQPSISTYQNVLTSDRVLKNAVARLPKPHRIDFKGIPKSRWLGTIKQNLTISSIPSTQLIRIRYTSRNPETAKFIVDAIVDAYFEYMSEIHRGPANATRLRLSREKNQIESVIRELETNLATLKRAGGIPSHGPDQQVNAIIERTAQLNDSLIEAQKKTLESRALLVSVQHALDAGTDMQTYLQHSVDESSREFLLQDLGVGTNGAISVLKAQDRLQSDENELQSRLLTLGPNHPQIRELQGRINQTKKWLSDRSYVVTNTLKDFRNQQLGPKLLERAKQRLKQSSSDEAEIRKAFESSRTQAMSLNGQMAQMDILERELKQSQRDYNVIVEQLKKTEVAADSGPTFTILTTAKIPSDAVEPQLSTTLFLFRFFGFVSGFALIALNEVFNNRFRSSLDLNEQLGLRLLATISEMETIPGKGVETVTTHSRPDAVESNSFRTLCHSLTSSARKSQCLVVTSAETADGKTTTVANLAVAFAQSNTKTLLIDADLRRSGTSQLFDLNGPRGLSQILRDANPIAESCLDNIFNIGVENLDVMPSGPRSSNPTELLSRDRFAELIAWAASVYDQVLIDAPSMVAVTDTVMISRLLDGVIVVIRPETYRRRKVLHAIESIQSAGAAVLGIVVNRVAINNDTSESIDAAGHDLDHAPDLVEMTIDDDESEGDDTPLLVAA